MYGVLVGARSWGRLNTKLLSFIYVNLKRSDKCYRIKRSTRPIEIINYKKLKQKEVDIWRTIRKYTNLGQWSNNPFEHGGKTPKNSSNGILKDNYHNITVSIKQVKPKWGGKHQKPGTTTPRADRVKKLSK